MADDRPRPDEPDDQRPRDHTRRKRSHRQEDEDGTRRRKERLERKAYTSIAALHDAIEVPSRQTFDYHSAWATAREILRRVVKGFVHPDEDYRTVERAAEFFWDHSHLEEASKLVDAWAAFIQRAKVTDTAFVAAETISLRDTRAARLRVAFLHRAYDPIGAWTLIKAEYRRLTTEAGGAEELSRLIATAPFEDLGLQYTELLDMAVPASRRVPESMRAPHRDIFLRDALTIIAQISEENPRGHALRYALVDQTLFAILELRDPDRHGKTVVPRSYQLDSRLRPHDRRGQATRHLMNMEIARYYGNEPGAELYVARAMSELKSAGLLRHLREVRGRYL